MTTHPPHKKSGKYFFFPVKTKIISFIWQTDLDFLVAHTQFSEEKITEWYRGFKQDCPEGKLT